MSLTFERSYPVQVIPYQSRWPQEFQTLKSQMTDALGELALRIDHIGSTSVPGLAAKDIIDVQITVADIQNPAFLDALSTAGFTVRDDIQRDNFIGIDDPESPELEKRYAKPPSGQRNANIHIRELGRLNQRYALLFRDFLRANPLHRDGYALIKTRLAEIFPESIDGYLYIKDPLMDMMFVMAETWAKSIDWQL